MTVSSKILSDPMEIVRAEAQKGLPREGEYTLAEIVIILGIEKMGRYRQEMTVKRLVENGYLVERKPFASSFYSLANSADRK